MGINWKVRFKHKGFITSIIALSLVLLNQVLAIFGIDFTVYNEQITNISESILAILGLLGVIIDPTTSNIGDSKQALSYRKPKE